LLCLIDVITGNLAGSVTRFLLQIALICDRLMSGYVACGLSDVSVVSAS